MRTTLHTYPDWAAGGRPPEDGPLIGQVTCAACLSCWPTGCHRHYYGPFLKTAGASAAGGEILARSSRSVIDASSEPRGERETAVEEGLAPSWGEPLPVHPIPGRVARRVPAAPCSCPRLPCGPAASW